MLNRMSEYEEVLARRRCKPRNLLSEDRGRFRVVVIGEGGKFRGVSTKFGTMGYLTWS